MNVKKQKALLRNTFGLIKIRQRFCALLFFCFVGCSSEKTVLRPVDVEVPVAVSCNMALPQPPVFAFGVVSENSGFYEKVRAALVEIEQRKAYEEVLKSYFIDAPI